MSARQAHIIGAGFSGLTVAYFLIKNGWDVEIFEKSDRVGGLIQTLRTRYGTVETAANGILNSKLFEDLCAEIGVQLQASKKEARARYFFREGQPRRWPWNFAESLSLARFAFFYLFFKSRVQPQKQETVREWGIRCLGLRLSQYSIETALQGIYGSETEKLSASLVLSFLFRKRRTLSRPTLGRGTVAPALGMAELTEKLAVFLKKNKVQFQFGCQIESPNQLSLYAAKPAQAVVIATSVNAVASLLKESADPQFSFLKKAQMKSLTTSTVFWKNPSLPFPGFGILFPRPEAVKALGVLRPDSIFAGRTAVGISSETWIWPMAATSEVEWRELVQKEHKQVLGTKGSEELLAQTTTSWPEALPVYDTNWERALVERPQNQGPIYLIGNYLGEIGLKSILERAQSLAEQMSGEVK